MDPPYGGAVDSLGSARRCRDPHPAGRLDVDRSFDHLGTSSEPLTDKVDKHSIKRVDACHRAQCEAEELASAPLPRPAAKRLAANGWRQHRGDWYCGNHRSADR
jgi:hypothetical protein